MDARSSTGGLDLRLAPVKNIGVEEKRKKGQRRELSISFLAYPSTARGLEHIYIHEDHT